MDSLEANHIIVDLELEMFEFMFGLRQLMFCKKIASDLTAVAQQIKEVTKIEKLTKSDKAELKDIEKFKQNIENLNLGDANRPSFIAVQSAE